MALASQTVRSQSVRSSAAYNRQGGGGGRGSGRARQKRLIGIVALAVLSGALVWYAVKHRDGVAPASARGGGAGPDNTLAAGSTAPGTTSLIAPDPLGGPAAALPPIPLPSATPVNPPAASLSMGSPMRDIPSGASRASHQPPPSTPSIPQAAIPAPAASQPTPTPPPTRDPQPTPALSDDNLGAGVLAAASAAADRSIAQAKPLEARGILNRALLDQRSTDAERATLRKKLADLNQMLVFGPAQTAGDPFSDTYRVVAGDSLTKIARKLSLITEPSAIGRINKLATPGNLKVGQTLKVLRGPFHAVVDKSVFRMDIYAGPTPSPTSLGTANLPESAEPGWTYICSFPVGLGDKGLTPIGNFTIKEGSKLINPHWANPRTGEKFGADDPKNPIGERWMGLEGLDEKSRAFTGYGIHGTIAPDSIGHEMSMGCVRMNAADVEQVYEMLSSRVSVVKIVP